MTWVRACVQRRCQSAGKRGEVGWCGLTEIYCVCVHDPGVVVDFDKDILCTCGVVL